MAALKLPNVGYATNADHGMGCNIHPAASNTSRSASPRRRSRSATVERRYGVAALRERERRRRAAVQQKVRIADVSAQGLHLIRPFNYASPGYGPSLVGVGDSPAEVQVNCSGSFPINQTANASMQAMYGRHCTCAGQDG